MKRLFLFVALMVAVAFGATRTAKTLTVEGDPVKQRDQSYYVVPAQFNKVCSDLDTLFDMTTGLSADVVTKDYAVFDSTAITSLRDDGGARFLGVTKRYSINLCARFDTSEANATEQGIVVDSLPAYARLMDAWVVCTDSVQDEADSAQVVVSLEIGTASGGAQVMAAGNVDANGDIKAMTVTEAYDLAPATVKQAIFLSATPDSDWTDIYRGAWNVYLQYNDNGSY